MKRIWLLLALGLASHQATGNGEVASPNMGLPVPAVGVTVGPQWASDVNQSLGLIDSHDHSSGKGVPVTPAGFNFSADLTARSNNLTNARSVRLQPYATLGAFSSTAADLGAIFEVANDLYYVDGNGNVVQMTSMGFVNSGAGSISGLSGFPFASASYNGTQGTFIFQQGTSTAGNMDAATLILRYPGSYPTPAGNYIAIQAPTSLATGYAMTLPATLPATSGALLTESTAGIVSYTNVDNSTLQNVAGTIAVKSAGITATQLAANSVGTTQLAGLAVTQVKKERRTDGTSTAGLGGVAQAGVSLTTSSTSFVSAGQCILATNGGPVVITLSEIPGSANTGFFYFASVTPNSPSKYMQYRVVGNNGSDHELARYSVHSPFWADPFSSGFVFQAPFIDIAPGTKFIGKPNGSSTPDTWTFRLELLVDNASNSAVIDNWLISAYEL